MRLVGKALMATVVLANVAWAQQQMDAAKAERCASRLSIAITGKSASTTLLADPNPQSQVDALLATTDFQDRFARFINATFNADPGAVPAEDAAYWLSKYVLVNNKPWSDLFLGAYNVDVASGQAADSANVVVTADPNGLGYFRSKPWMLRYAGNELQGIKISTGYRMMNNTIGLTLVASTNAPGADVSQNGRQSAGCRACHFDGWFALDSVASVLSRKVTTTSGSTTTISFGAPPASPQTIFGGITVADDYDVVSALVNSEAFKFRACRLAFMYLYGRPEQTCEGPVFDKCMDAFSASGMITDAIKTVATDATYCQ
jgi:hypothetical protein